MVAILAEKKDTTGFGDRLRALRAEKGLSQAALGKLCQPAIRYQEISRYESGERSPSWETVVRIARALNVTPDSFLNDDTDDTSPAKSPKK